jgi:predicted nuclease of restriction endonuclease-like (RecB) superfamily
MIMAAKRLLKSSKRKAGRVPSHKRSDKVGRDELVVSLPIGYAELLNDLKGRIRSAQVRAALSVNRELVGLYWQIGRSIVERQRDQLWGAKVIDRLAEDLQREFPGERGFSRGNLFRMRNFYLAYAAKKAIVAQPARQLAKSIVAQPVRQLENSNLSQPVREIPWGHNIVLIEKLEQLDERLWYAQQTTVQGWSRAVLIHQIESSLYQRSGKAITNFAATLPAPASDLAPQLIKDPYNFDFLTLAPDAQERDLEAGLIEHLKKFLLELGVGFAFVGQQHHLEVGGEDFYIDLLFYHLKLRRYVVIDLKVEEFKPEFAGKMNFYLSAIDDQFRNGDDQSSIGLILCKTRNRVIAEYALRDTAEPVGAATCAAALPAALRASLPSPAELARELNPPQPPDNQITKV